MPAPSPLTPVSILLLPVLPSFIRLSAARAEAGPRLLPPAYSSCTPSSPAQWLHRCRPEISHAPDNIWGFLLPWTPRSLPAQPSAPLPYRQPGGGTGCSGADCPQAAPGTLWCRRSPDSKVLLKDETGREIPAL